MQDTAQLKKGLGFWEALAIVVGRIIGSGIFRTPGPIFIVICGLDLTRNYQAGEVPLAQVSIGLFLIAWIVGGLATYLGALCYAELVSLLPHSGGPYAYLKTAYPEWVSFLRGWAMFFVSETAAIVAVALVFSEYGAMLLEQAWGISLSRNLQAIVALVLLWLLTWLNCYGVVLSGFAQNILAALKVLALLVMSGFFWGIGGDSLYLSQHFWPKEGWSWGQVLLLGQAMRYTFFAYSGWEGATYVAEEVHEPRRTLPLSLFVGIGFVMLLYLAVNTGYLRQLGPLGMIVESQGIAAAAMEIVLGLGGAMLLSGFVLLSTAGNVNTQILVKARTWHAMARDGLFFTTMAKLHPGYQSPNHALLLQASWATVLLLASLFWYNSYEALIDFFSFTSTLFNLLTFGAVWILRKKMCDEYRAFRVPFLAGILGLVLFIQLSFLLITLYDRPLESLMGLGLCLSGLFYYFYKKKWLLKTNGTRRT